MAGGHLVAAHSRQGKAIAATAVRGGGRSGARDGHRGSSDGASLVVPHVAVDSAHNRRRVSIATSKDAGQFDRYLGGPVAIVFPGPGAEVVGAPILHGGRRGGAKGGRGACRLALPESPGAVVHLVLDVVLQGVAAVGWRAAPVDGEG